jgi:hypothetical protein
MGRDFAMFLPFYQYLKIMRRRNRGKRGSWRKRKKRK